MNLVLLFCVITVGSIHAYRLDCPSCGIPYESVKEISERAMFQYVKENNITHYAILLRILDQVDHKTEKKRILKAKIVIGITDCSLYENCIPSPKRVVSAAVLVYTYNKYNGPHTTVDYYDHPVVPVPRKGYSVRESEV